MKFAKKTLLTLALLGAFTASAAEKVVESAARTLTGVTVSSRPKTVFGGVVYPASLECTATFSDGRSKKVKATWSVVRGAATVTAAGDLRVSPKAVDTVKVKAKYAYSGKTCSATASIKVLERTDPAPEVTLKKFIVHGPDSLPSGGSAKYWALAIWSNGATGVVEKAEWSQLTGADRATMSVEEPVAYLTALPGEDVGGTLLKAVWGDRTAVKRVEIVPPGATEFAAPVLCADGDPTGVLRTSFSLPIRVDSAAKATVTVRGLPDDLGLVYDAKKSVISGVPKKTGSFKISVSATSAVGKAKKLSLTIKVLDLPGWAKGSFAGLAQYDLLSKPETQVCPYANATAKLKSSGAVSLTLSFADDVEKFSSKKYASATIKKGKVTALALSGTVKAVNGRFAAVGEVTSRGFRLWSTDSRQVYAETFRRLSTSVSSEKKKIARTAGRNYRLGDLAFVVDRNGKMTVSGRNAGKRKLSGSCAPLLKDGAVYYLFVLTPTGKGGNGYLIALWDDGSGMKYGDLSF